MSPLSQFAQKPQAMLNGRQTISPTLMRSTALPTSITSPRFSCPIILPFSKSVQPSYMCRSEPQMLVLVILTSTSVGRSIFASGTSFTLTSRGPLYTTAFIHVLLCTGCIFQVKVMLVAEGYSILDAASRPIATLKVFPTWQPAKSFSFSFHASSLRTRTKLSKSIKDCLELLFALKRAGATYRTRSF